MRGPKIAILAFVAVAVAIVGAFVYSGVQGGAEAIPLPDIEVRAKPGLVGPRNVNPCEGPDKNYTFQVRNNEAFDVLDVPVQVTVMPLSGAPDPTVTEIFGSSAGGSSVAYFTSVPIAMADLDLVAGDTLAVHVRVAYVCDDQGGDTTPEDFELLISVASEPDISKLINDKNR